MVRKLDGEMQQEPITGMIRTLETLTEHGIYAVESFKLKIITNDFGPEFIDVEGKKIVM